MNVPEAHTAALFEVELLEHEYSAGTTWCGDAMVACCTPAAFRYKRDELETLPLAEGSCLLVCALSGLISDAGVGAISR